MVLATHAVTGAALAQLVPEHPFAAFCIGFCSHFILDTIPHWDYPLKSNRENKENRLAGDIVVGKDLASDLMKIGSDATLGIILSIFFFFPHTPMQSLVLLCGAIGGMLPDPLQFAYYKIRKEPLISLQKFHMWIHAKLHLKDYPLPGATLQLLFVILVVSIIKAIL